MDFLPGMKDHVNIVLLVTAFAAISLIPPFYLAQGKTQNVIPHQEENNKILGIETQKNQNLPTRLVIPIINVNTAIQSVGVNSDGEMEVPNNSYEAGWFNLGPHPGETGSAVIAGHLDGVNGEPGVFIDLHKLKAGDKILVENSSGVTTTFIVKGSSIYDPGYAEKVFSSSSGKHLNLITCDGVWDGIKKSFSKRLVVFADIIN